MTQPDSRTAPALTSLKTAGAASGVQLVCTDPRTNACVSLSACRERQQTLGQAGAVAWLVTDLRALAQQPQQQPAGLVDTLQALLFTCCGHASNVQQLLGTGGLEQLTAVLSGPGAAASSHAVQLCCCLLAEAATAGGPSQLEAVLTGLEHAACQERQQLLMPEHAAAACSSCCAILWATSKAAAGYQCSDAGSSCSIRATLQQIAAAAEGIVLPVLAAAAEGAAAAVAATDNMLQQQYSLLLILALSCASQLSQWCKQQQVGSGQVAAWAQAVQGAVCTLGPGSSLANVVQAYWQSLQDSSSSGGTNPMSADQEQHGLQHLTSCQFLSMLQQLHRASSRSSSAAAAVVNSSSLLLRPLEVMPVSAGATATIEVVYAGSPASDKGSSCDDKELSALACSISGKSKARLSSSSSRERSPSDDSVCRAGGHGDTRDAAASPHVDQQQLVEQPGGARCAQQQQEQPAVAPDSDVLTCTTKTADSAPAAAEIQPGLQPRSRSVSSLCGPIYADAEASSSSASVSTIGTLPPRSELCSSSSSNSIQACGDGQSGTTAGTGRAEGTEGAGQGSSSSGGSGSGGQPERGTDSSSGRGDGQHSSGGGGGGNSNSGGDDDRPGDDEHDHPTCTSPPSDDTTATATALSTSSDSIVLSPMAGISAAHLASAAAAAEAPVSLGCSASDPVIVPRPSPLGALPGLMLRGSPASLGGAAAAPGTLPAGSSNSPGFSFPTNLAALNVACSSSAGPASYTPGGLADVLLSPSAFGARGLLGQGPAAGGLAGQGPFGPYAGPSSTGRRASDAGTLCAGSSLLGSWGSGLNPQAGAQAQPGAMPVGSWPSTAPGLGALEEHMQGQQRQHQPSQPPQQQQQPGAPPAAARCVYSDPALERRALSGYLHMLNPGLMGLIGSTDTAGSLGPVSGSTHLMSWLTEPASGLSSAGSGPTGAPIRPASAAAIASQGSGDAAAAPAGLPSCRSAAAAGSSQAAGTLTPQSSAGLPTSGSNSSSGDGTRDVGPRRDQRPPSSGPFGSAAPPKPSAPGTATKVLSGPVGPSASEGVAAAGGQAVLATAGSGSISSSGSFGGSGFGGMPHSCSGESLEDLEAMRLSSASFAAALAEAEAIAAGVAAHLAAAQQQGVQGRAAAPPAVPAGCAAAPAGDRCVTCCADMQHDSAWAEHLLHSVH